MPVPNLKSLVARVRKDYPAKMTPAQVGEAIYRIASEAQAMGHDIGVLLKKSGHRVPSPLGDISSDILVDIPDEQEYDVFTNADGGDTKKPQAGPVWNKLKSKVGGAHSGASMKNVKRPVGVAPEPQPVPTPDPPAPVPQKPEEPAKPEQPSSPCQCGEVVELLAAMRLENTERHEALVGRLIALRNDNRMPRKVSIGRWSGEGTMSGIEG